jgi:hypothetical protein
VKTCTKFCADETQSASRIEAALTALTAAFSAFLTVPLRP